MNSQAKIAAAIASILLILTGVWYIYHMGYEAGGDQVRAQWYAERTKIADEQKAALTAYADKLKKAEEQHDQDQIVIDRLHNDAGRVRIHLPTCPDSGTTGQHQNGGPGVFSDRVDESFARLQERAVSLFARCDQLNIDAIRANGSAGK